MPKLTKTEQKILNHMLARYGRYSATRSLGNGPKGGWRKSGQREFYACMNLVKKGLAIQIGDLYRHTIYAHGWGEHCTEISIKLPETN
jgi:hypothetical protein